MKFSGNYFLLGLFLFPCLLFSQSAKKFTSEGANLEDVGKYEEAVKAYSNAVGMDSAYYKAYAGRARCYVKIDKNEQAANDYKKVLRYNVKEKRMFYEAGVFYMEQKQLWDADVAFRKALEIDRVYADAIDAEVQVLVKMRDFTQALNITQLGIDSKMNAQNYYRHASIHDSLNHFEQAEKYYHNALDQDGKFLPAHVALAIVQVKLNKYDAALRHCEVVLQKEPENTDALFARSLVYAATKNLQNAINDISKVILTKPTEKAYAQRAEFYEGMGQCHNAATDYSSIIKENPNRYSAYNKRALCYEQMQQKKLANEDYSILLSLTKDKGDLKDFRETIVQKKYELNRESEKPEITLSASKEKNSIHLPARQNVFTVKGKVKDASPIKSITVNSQVATFKQDTVNPEFSFSIRDAASLEQITIAATDIYNNAQEAIYKISRTESDKPIIIIETPYTSSENEMSIDSNGPDLYIQGKIRDSSLIASIVIDGVNASYNSNYLNPEFSSQIKITDKSSIKITVRDIYGNETEQTFNLDRSSLLASVDNPMGKTWVVFIENSQYANFSSLEGPAKDAMSLKSALANYKITRIVHKKNMTKTELEKFFSLELRDYVKSNNVTSLLIWYAGHGKYVNPTGYWIPTDARPDEEFSYYGINNLKAAMQSYSERLIHTLVVTDACESGPTFLLVAKENNNEEKSCKNAEHIKSKSSQVFTSAGFELASDNSQFTKTFVSTLNNNTEECLPIDKIVKKVAYSVSQIGNQAPKFGRIKDLEDNGGTFFFIRK